MKRRELYNLFLLVLIAVLFTEVWITKLVSDSKLQRLDEKTVQTQEYRDMEIGEEMLAYILGKEELGVDVGLYLLESRFGYQKFPYAYSKGSFLELQKKWKNQRNWRLYRDYNRAIWDDLQYFPVAEFTDDKTLTVSFGNSWRAERNYGGKRFHEGTDIMASKNVAGIYPIVSMTDGIVRSKGWLEKGGYRIGIEAPSGAYFYYAHLHSYASLEIGDEVQAGELLGFMGDSGYGVEGTTGKFPVHLHLGVYIYPEKQEMSINPYWLLRYLENCRVKCSSKNLSYGDIR